MLKKQKAFSLIEVLVFVSILSIFFVLAAAVVTFSLRDMKFNEHKIKATHYSRQLEEWLRLQTEIDWGGTICNGCSSTTTLFTEQVTRGGVPTTSFCFNSSPISGWQALGLCSAYDLEEIFKREVTFTSLLVANYVTQVNASITISWLELGQAKNIRLNTIFSVLEQQ